MTRLRVAVALFAAITGMAKADDDDAAYTLYRSSITAEMRIHIATFDTAEGEAYNRENCQIAADLFKAQPGVSVRYWCEKGRYRN